MATKRTKKKKNPTNDHNDQSGLAPWGTSKQSKVSPPASKTVQLSEYLKTVP